MRLIPLGCLLCVIGCSKNGGHLTLESPDRLQPMNLELQQAYLSSPRSGEYDIVFVDSGAEWRFRKPRKNRPLQPTPLSPVRQVMHIHLYWKPIAGVTKNPAAINAAINWYVLGPDGSNDLLIYRGAGLVHLNGSRVDIRDGNLTPHFERGDINDPIGPARISGSVVARLDDARVQETLAEMEQTAVSSTAVAPQQ